jgi:hypothetical protein
MATTIVFGAGISGLSTAHYLAQRGYKVIVIEKLDQAGGMARGQRTEGNIPSEVSWRAWGPFYANMYDIMKDIPFKESTVFDRGFSGEGLRPNFVADDMPLLHNGKIRGSKLTFIDKIKLKWLFINGWCACEKRDNEVYANEFIYPKLCKYLTKVGGNDFAASYGHFAGGDYVYQTSHHLYSFYKKSIFGGKKWQTLQGPINEYFFDPWVEYLKGLGVEFRFGESLSYIGYSPQDQKILDMEIDDGKMTYSITADNYVLAINPFALCQILNKEPVLFRLDKQLRGIYEITRQNENRQISFRIAFSDKIHFKNRNNFIVLTDSEFGISFCPYDNVWHQDVNLGDDVKSLWSGIASVDTCNGKLHGMMRYLTYDEFVKEIKHQIYRSQTLNNIIKRDNNGRELKDFGLIKFEVWPEWNFVSQDNTNVRGHQPKWINTINTRKYQPKTKTSIPGLYLAGAHCQTSADLWCMEAAAESGREVADDISQIKSVHKWKEPGIFKPFKVCDEFLYNLGLPNVIVCILVLIIIGLIVIYYYTKWVLVLAFLAIVISLSICLMIKEQWSYKTPKSWDSSLITYT